MEDFIRNNLGYFIGIVLTPITWKIFEAFKRTFKSTIHKKDTPKNSSTTNHS